MKFRIFQKPYNQDCSELGSFWRVVYQDRCVYSEWHLCLLVNVVSVIWNGTVITGPILIYHDEITDDLTTVPTVGNSNGPGDLVCRTEYHEEARWRNPNGHNVPRTGNYRQVGSAAGVPSLSRLSTPNTLIGGDVKGLWICQVHNSSIPDQDILKNFNYVGIYNRGDGE